jgi:hypothetical protein
MYNVAEKVTSLMMYTKMITVLVQTMKCSKVMVMVLRLSALIRVEGLSGIHPGYSCKEGRRAEDGLLLEFPCTPTRTRFV